MLLSIALDWHHADVTTRERFHPTVERLAQLYDRVHGDRVEELAMLATCNRAELYASLEGSPGRAAVDRAYDVLARRWMGGGTAARALLASTVRRENLGAARHLIRVATGLESQILGDGQILSQVRGAYRLAAETGAAGSVLHRLFETALRAGKRVQRETSLSCGRMSIGAAAAVLVARRFGPLGRVRVVVVGAGKTAERVARSLVKHGVRDLVIVNRTATRAAPLVSELKVRYAPLEALYSELAMADAAVLATGSSEALVRLDPLQRSRVNCATESVPLMLIDLGLPRNIDPTVTALAGVTLVDLDAMHVPVVAAERQRQDAVPAAEVIVDAEAQAFEAWMASATARTAMRPLRDVLTEVCRREVAFAAGDAIAERTAERIVAKIMARPMSAVRRAVERGDSIDDMATALGALFVAPGGRS